MEELAELEEGDDKAALDQIRANAPNAIPRAEMRTLWGLLLSGRVGSQRDDLDFYRWCSRFRRDGLTITLRLELLEKLKPCVIASLLETCRMNGVEPYAWLKSTLEKIACGHPQSRIRELLPRAFNPASD